MRLSLIFNLLQGRSPFGQKWALPHNRAEPYDAKSMVHNFGHDARFQNVSWPLPRISCLMGFGTKVCSRLPAC